MSVRKVFCEVTDFSGDTIALTSGQAWRAVRVRESEGATVLLGGGLRACWDARVGVVVRCKEHSGWWVISPRDVASIRRLLAKAEEAA